MVPPPAGGDDFVGIGASCEGLCFSIALVSIKMKDVTFDSAELVVRRALRSFDQKKSVAYPGRFSVRVAKFGFLEASFITGPYPQRRRR